MALGLLVSVPVRIEPSFDRLEAGTIAQCREVAIRQDNFEVPGGLALMKKGTVENDLEDMAFAPALLENRQMLGAIELQLLIGSARRDLVVALHRRPRVRTRWWCLGLNAPHKANNQGQHKGYQKASALFHVLSLRTSGGSTQRTTH